MLNSITLLPLILLITITIHPAIHHSTHFSILKEQQDLWKCSYLGHVDVYKWRLLWKI